MCLSKTFGGGGSCRAMIGWPLTDHDTAFLPDLLLIDLLRDWLDP